jgi:hypothetical protein
MLFFWIYSGLVSYGFELYSSAFVISSLKHMDWMPISLDS